MPSKIGHPQLVVQYSLGIVLITTKCHIQSFIVFLVNFAIQFKYWEINSVYLSILNSRRIAET